MSSTKTAPTGQSPACWPTAATRIAHKRRGRWLLPLALLLTPASQACGPDFPLQLMSHRLNNLQSLPESTFGAELAVLAAPIPALPTASPLFQSHYDYQQDRLLSATEQAEQQLLSAEQASQIKALRQLNDATQVLAQAGNLPAELRLYTAAAVAFSSQPAQAADLFRQLLALPAAEQSQRRSWALYSLARLLQQGDEAAQQQAVALYQQLRQEVAAGLADPLQLAVSSLGEEARLALGRQDWATAIALYASQAGYEESGRASLLQVSSQLLAKPDAELGALLGTPAVSRLLAIYLQSNAQSLQYQDPQQLSRVLTLLAQQPQVRLHNALELAQVHYQLGHFDLVSPLLAQAPDHPYKWWLSAKMAVRANDLTAAAAAYAKAAQAFPQQLPPPALAADHYAEIPRPALLRQIRQQTQCRVQAEAGVLQLQRGDYLQAMRLLYQAGAEYWQDTAYIAERVLTTAELQQFVDAEVPAGQPKAPSEWSWFGDTEPNTLLRQLLARRLLREGELQQAQAYFVEPAQKTLAQKYQQLSQQSADHWLHRLGRQLGVDLGQIEQAKALSELAVLTRRHGLELIGYELAPDYQVFYGQFEFWRYDDPQRQPDWPLPAGEQQRLAQSMAVPDKRFHYRYKAAELAAQSASLVPANSQAFAASLCQATTWLINRDPALAQQYYQRYLQQGAYVAWGTDFGIRCPAPDFAAAAARLADNSQREWRTQLRAVKPFWPLLPLLLGLAGWFWWRRRTADQ